MSNDQFGPRWLTGRETWDGSLAFGEVVLPEIALSEHPGLPPDSGKVIGSLPHGRCIDILEKAFIEKENRSYYLISSSGLRGWVSEPFVADRWSIFTFTGKLIPEDCCDNLDLSFEYAGMHLMLKGSGFAIITEGNPTNFDAINSATEKLIERLAYAQAPISTVDLNIEYSNWVEMPSEGSEGSRTVGFITSNRKTEKVVSNDDFQTSFPILRLMAIVPYLDLALSDFSNALRYPPHALIFLTRAIESIENHFSGQAKQQKGIGKEQLMRNALNLKKSDVEYITKRANESHRRHAARDGLVANISVDELANCFHKTAKIIASFASFLAESGL